MSDIAASGNVTLRLQRLVDRAALLAPRARRRSRSDPGRNAPRQSPAPMPKPTWPPRPAYRT
ncbi:hypothetical protein LP420_34605 [Massilia sp. B-10]|nr:hypothetical protein LP420_34605 [Massilia sp. B-10]